MLTAFGRARQRDGAVYFWPYLDAVVWVSIQDEGRYIDGWRADVTMYARTFGTRSRFLRAAQRSLQGVVSRIAAVEPRVIDV